MRLTLADVVDATGGAPEGPGGPGTAFGAVSTDTRTLRPGDLFVALRGPRYDGHDYLAEAAARGAAGVVLHRGEAPAGVAAVRVPDTLRALGDLGRWVRRRLGLRVIAITGSAGKTTTRELTAALLRHQGLRTLQSPGNWNNRIGLPLTLLGARGDEQAAVVELGISERGEMADLTRIAEPDVAVITNVAPCHTEGLGGIEGVAREKLTILQGLRPGGTLVVPHGDPLVAPPPGVRAVTFGWSPEASVHADAYACEGDRGCRVRLRGREIRLPLPGRHNALNALAALAAVEALGVSAPDPAAAWAGLHPAPMRGEIRHTRSGLHLVVDCYNANPRAVEAALGTLSELAGPSRKIAVLGEMRELGELCRRGHEDAGRAAARCGVDELHLLGPATVAAREAAAAEGIGPERIWIYEDRAALAAALRRRLRPGDWVLVKGSRALGLETVVEELER